MSVHVVYFKDGEKTKYLRPVLNRADYLALRNGDNQQQLVAAVRAGDEQLKSKLVQMNYSCLPNDDGSLKGSKRMSTTVGMDIDHVPADSLIENALHFFRDRIENAFCSRDYAGYQNGDRLRRGKNDSIFERLDVQFTFEQAMQHAVAVKGAGVTHNTVRQMLKNWRHQGLVVQTEGGRYRKM